MNVDRIVKNLMGIPENETLYTFHRKEGWYPISLKNDEDAKANAFFNPGTLKVVNEQTGETVWNTEP